MKRELIVSPLPEPRQDGLVLEVSPESAGWSYVGFRVYRLAAGQTLREKTRGLEACLVLLSGLADISTLQASWKGIGKRMSVFEKIPPYAVYVPNGDEYTVTALTELELAVALAPSAGKLPARLIEPDMIQVEARGYGAMERRIHNILPEKEQADSLLVVEVITPQGHWSSYPPHKHDQNALPDESLLEETYYYHVEPKQGFAIQRVYTDDRTLDETLALRDGQTVLVPEGYHPVSAPPGYEVYYLNVMAGPVRTWKFRNDPDHSWLMEPPGSPAD